MTPTTAPWPRKNSSPASTASGEAGRFGVGLNHIIEVLTGADTEKIRRWGHERLSTYGIGSELSRPEWAAVGRELDAARFVAQSQGNSRRSSSPRDGLACSARASRSASPSRWIRRRPAGVRREGDIACDEILFARLRELRKKLADERGCPPMSFLATRRCADGALVPATEAAMHGLPGVGEKKRAEFGASFAAAIRAFLETNPRMGFTD